jgi:aldose 1-epimerase
MPSSEHRHESGISKNAFGKLDDGETVYLYTLKNKTGASVTIMDLGATIISINVPDKDNIIRDITLGFDTPQAYLDHSLYFGATIGRYANRIAGSSFSLDGKRHTLTCNENTNQLHGGHAGFDKKRWEAELIYEETYAVALRFTLKSPDGDEGFPGNLVTTVTYSFDDENQLIITFTAKTDAPTIINLTQHGYFNLNGHNSESITNHELMIPARYYTPIRADMIPTGKLAAVNGTPMDFTEPRVIGDFLDSDFEQLRFGGGFDHNWVLNDDHQTNLTHAAWLHAPNSGRTLDVYTNQPGIQFYSGNFIEGDTRGKNNTVYNPRSGLCLEAQNFPDSPNQQHFPSSILRPNDTYHKQICYKFGVK